MSDLPKKVDIQEEGPREGFQIEPGPIATERKIELIDALSPGRVAEFLERHPGRTREFYVTADGMVVSAAPGDRETRAIRDSEVVLFARRLKKRHLDLRA